MILARPEVTDAVIYAGTAAPMADTFDFPDISDRLAKLEEAFQDHNSYQFKRLTAELRRAVKMRANAAALARAELLDCRKDTERNRKQCVDLQAKLKTVVDRFEGSFTAFEKFRKAIRVVEMMRSHDRHQDPGEVFPQGTRQDRLQDLPP